MEEKENISQQEEQPTLEELQAQIAERDAKIASLSEPKEEEPEKQEEDEEKVALDFLRTTAKPEIEKMFEEKMKDMEYGKNLEYVKSLGVDEGKLKSIEILARAEGMTPEQVAIKHGRLSEDIVSSSRSLVGSTGAVKQQAKSIEDMSDQEYEEFKLKNGYGVVRNQRVF